MLIKILYLALIQASTVFSKIPLCNTIQSEKSVCSLSENYNPGFPGTVALTPQNLDSFTGCDNRIVLPPLHSNVERGG